MVVNAAAKSLQSCPTLCDPRDGSPPGSAVPGILQGRTLEWVAISFSNAWSVLLQCMKWKVKVKSLSRVQLFETPWTAAYQAPPSMGFSRQQYWSGVPSNCSKFSIWVGCFGYHLAKEVFIKIVRYGTSLMVQWLRLQAPNAGGLGRELDPTCPS